MTAGWGFGIGRGRGPGNWGPDDKKPKQLDPLEKRLQDIERRVKALEAAAERNSGSYTK